MERNDVCLLCSKDNPADHSTFCSNECMRKYRQRWSDLKNSPLWEIRNRQLKENDNYISKINLIENCG